MPCMLEFNVIQYVEMTGWILERVDHEHNTRKYIRGKNLRVVNRAECG